MASTPTALDLELLLFLCRPAVVSIRRCYLYRHVIIIRQYVQGSSGGLGVDRLGDRLAASSLTMTTGAGAGSSFQSPIPFRAAAAAARGDGGDGDGDRRLHAAAIAAAGFSSCKEASPSAESAGKDDGYCGLGGAEGEAAYGDEDTAVGREGVDTQVRGVTGLRGGDTPTYIASRFSSCYIWRASRCGWRLSYLFF